MKRLLLMVVTGGLMAAIVAGPAGADGNGAKAGTPKFDSKAKVLNFLADPRKRGLEGVWIAKVKSENPNCKPDRKGKIWRRQPGPDELIGKGTTDTQGIFTVDDTAGTGRYYATVSKAEIPAGLCRGDSSADYTIG